MSSPTFVPELALALQAALIAQESLIFEDDEVYKTVNAYASKKNVVLVGARRNRGCRGVERVVGSAWCGAVWRHRYGEHAAEGDPQ